MRKNRKTLLITVFLVYCLFIVWMTVIKREPRVERKFVLDLFWAFRKWILGYKNGRKESIQYINNILLFVPFGMLFPWKKKGWKTLLLAALSFSMAIEAVQFFFALGWCELDDVISNTLGAAMGFGVYLLLARLFGEKHIWKKF